MSDYRECVHIKADCIHKSCKCSECPMTDLICDEFYACIDRCHEEAYADGCLAGIELGEKQTIEKGRQMVTNAYEEMRRMARKYIEDGKIIPSMADKMAALSDCYTMFIQVFNRLEEESKNEKME